jgi:hypothetical protein
MSAANTFVASEELHALAEQLQPNLQGSDGSTPPVPHIIAAVLLSRDSSLNAHAVCHAVPGVPESASGSVEELTARLSELLSTASTLPLPAAASCSNPAPSSSCDPDTLDDAPSGETEADPWPHDQPPRLREDFGGCSVGRGAYEAARARWFHRQCGVALPRYDPAAPLAVQQQQILERAAPWDRAVRSYKDRLRDRSNRVRPADARRQMAHSKVRQQLWVDDAVAIGVYLYDADDAKAAGDPAPPMPSSIPAQLRWPLNQWRGDPFLLDLCEYLEDHPPTGEQAWCDAVEAAAATIYGLGRDDYWDFEEAPGYRMLLSLPNAPSGLKALPLDDRLWIRRTQEALEPQHFRGDTLERMYQIVYDQYLGQLRHPRGILSEQEYQARVGYHCLVPIGDIVRRVLPDDSDLLLAPTHPNIGPMRPQLRSLTRPHTDNYPYEISARVRASIEATLDATAAAAKQGNLGKRANKGSEARRAIYSDFNCRGIIPFGDLYYMDSLHKAVKKLYALGCPMCGARECCIDLAAVLRDAAAAQDRWHSPSMPVPRTLKRHRTVCRACKMAACPECEDE